MHRTNGAKLNTFRSIPFTIWHDFSFYSCYKCMYVEVQHKIMDNQGGRTRTGTIQAIARYENRTHKTHATGICKLGIETGKMLFSTIKCVWVYAWGGRWKEKEPMFNSYTFFRRIGKVSVFSYTHTLRSKSQTVNCLSIKVLLLDVI